MFLKGEIFLKNKGIKSWQKITGTLLTVIAYMAFNTGCAPTESIADVPYEEYNSGIESSFEVDLPEESLENRADDTENVEPLYGNLEEKTGESSEPVSQSEPSSQSNIAGDVHPDTVNYKLIKVDGGDTSGYRQANVVVNIGHGNREYWAYTNQYGQLVRVVAKEIIVQNDATENVTSDGRYYSKMADVPGVGADLGYDRGHVIADSLGGVANAYNITPQEATLNRHGDQAYMERNIRDAGGATDFEAIITYPNTETQTPSHYQYTYTIKGNTVTDSFENKNPDKVNSELGITEPASKPSAPSKPESTPAPPVSSGASDLNEANPGNVVVGNVSAVDTNGNGTVTIQEAKDAGFSMPIYQGHWLYEHMRDNNNNGMVGE